MDKIYSSAYSYYKYLTSSYTEYIEYIRDHGNTPPYTINNNKITIKFSCYSKGSKGQDLYASFNETYYLKNDGGMYCIEEIAVISPRRYRDSSLAKAVRKAVLEDFCDSRNISFTERYYQLRYAVEYLSKNYKGKWWERPWGNPKYGY